MCSFILSHRYNQNSKEKEQAALAKKQNKNLFIESVQSKTQTKIKTKHKVKRAHQINCN